MGSGCAVLKVEVEYSTLNTTIEKLALLEYQIDSLAILSSDIQYIPSELFYSIDTPTIGCGIEDLGNLSYLLEKATRVSTVFVCDLGGGIYLEINPDNIWIYSDMEMFNDVISNLNWKVN